MKRLIEQSSAAAVKLQHEAMKQMAEATEAAKAKAPNAAQLCIAAQQAAGKAQEMAECRLAGISAPQRKWRAAASHCRWCAIVCIAGPVPAAVQRLRRSSGPHSAVADAAPAAPDDADALTCCTDCRVPSAMPNSRISLAPSVPRSLAPSRLLHRQMLI